MSHMDAEQRIAKRFISKLDEFRSMGKYTDVTIECDNTAFNCHRVALAVASDYFDEIFSRKSNVLNRDKPIVVPRVKAITFASVLQFVYTGNLVITADNVETLLRTSDSLGIEDLEDLCIRFISENIKNVNLLDIFIFACTTQKCVLIDLLSQCDMTKELDEFFRRDGHCQLPFHVFAMILKLWKSTSQDPINRWINYSEEGRQQHFNDLAKIRGDFISTTIHPSLHVYVQYYGSNATTKVYNINGTPPAKPKCSFACNVRVPNCSSTYAITAPVVVDDSRIYYVRDRKCETYCADFVSCTSISMYPLSILQPAPVHSYDFVLNHVFNHGIYLYDTLLLSRRNRYFNRIIMLDDEIHRGIFFYNIEIDTWFPVPAMKERVQNACMTVLNNIVYLIGGEKNFENIGNVQVLNCVQAYDHRIGNWLEMPRTQLRYPLFGKCCVLNEKIYLCGAGTNGVGAERFDAVASKWEKIKCSNLEVTLDCKLASYANKLWKMDNHHYGTNLYIDVYDPESNTWRISHMLKKESHRNDMYGKSGTVVASIIFKSPSQ